MNDKYKIEYDKYMESFKNLSKGIVADCPHAVSKALCTVSGIRVRVGQMCGDLDREFSPQFSIFKSQGCTDKDATNKTKTVIDYEFGVGVVNIENLYKDLDSLEKSLKKRIAVLALDYNS